MPLQFEEEHIIAKANRLARDAVKAAAALHNPKPFHYHGGTSTICDICLTVWPCKTISALGEAEEAVGIAEEFEADALRVHTCGALERRATHLEPAEYCGNEVEHEGEHCPEHDGSFEDERDERAYQDYKERNL